MKKYHFMFSALVLGLLVSAPAFADRTPANGNYSNRVYQEGEIDPSAEFQSGPCVCYCPVTRFKPQYYCVEKCVEEPYTVQKKCCRYVDQSYTKKHCRYVPEYYTKTFCRQVPEYYEKTYCKKVPEYYTVCETKCRKKTVKEQKCRYVPYTTIEKRCIDAPASSGCVTCPTSGTQFAQPANVDSSADYYDDQYRNGNDSNGNDSNGNDSNGNDSNGNDSNGDNN